MDSRILERGSSRVNAKLRKRDSCYGTKTTGAFDIELLEGAPPASVAQETHSESTSSSAPSGGSSVQSGQGASGASGPKTAESIRMDPARLESLLDLVGELVVIKSQILMEFSEGSRAQIRANSLLTLFDRTVRDLQDVPSGCG